MGVYTTETVIKVITTDFGIDNVLITNIIHINSYFSRIQILYIQTNLKRKKKLEIKYFHRTINLVDLYLKNITNQV